MPCNASYARFIFGKFFTSTIILYALLFAQNFFSLQKVGVTACIGEVDLGEATFGVRRRGTGGGNGCGEVLGSSWGHFYRLGGREVGGGSMNVLRWRVVFHWFRYHKMKREGGESDGHHPFQRR
jgi:hypothetical protein